MDVHLKQTCTGYGSQNVKLQFCKAGSMAYTTVKTVKVSTTGVLEATVTASVVAAPPGPCSFVPTDTHPITMEGNI